MISGERDLKIRCVKRVAPMLPPYLPLPDLIYALVERRGAIRKKS